MSAHFNTVMISILKAHPNTSDEPFILPPLPYAYNALAPIISPETMHYHHDKHHAAYVKNLNEIAEEYPQIGKVPLDFLAHNLESLPDDIRIKTKNNLGGHLNHTMFWQIMKPGKSSPSKDLLHAIEKDFDDIDNMKEKFNKYGKGVFGSGWVFITLSRYGKLNIETKPNQDSPIMDEKRVLLGNDVWEHAYYIDYRNKRDEYLDKWWDLVNWDIINNRFEDIHSGKCVI